MVAKISQQQMDVSRPHTLLTQDVKRSGSLEFRYDDTQEVVTVPNIWYNQTYQARVASVRWEAQLQDEAAEKFQKLPSSGLGLEAVAQIVARYRATAARMRAEADRMERAGALAYPAPASRIPLHHSEGAAA